jgi:hypothetical protein
MTSKLACVLSAVLFNAMTATTALAQCPPSVPVAIARFGVR